MAKATIIGVRHKPCKVQWYEVQISTVLTKYNREKNMMDDG
jgi:hypothetical protein